MQVDCENNPTWTYMQVDCENENSCRQTVRTTWPEHTHTWTVKTSGPEHTCKWTVRTTGPEHTRRWTVRMTGSQQAYTQVDCENKRTWTRRWTVRTTGPEHTHRWTARMTGSQQAYTQVDCENKRTWTYRWTVRTTGPENTCRRTTGNLFISILHLFHAEHLAHLSWVWLQQCYLFPLVHALFSCVQAKYGCQCSGFLTHMQELMHATDCTWAPCKSTMRFCAESCLWEKESLRNQKPGNWTFISTVPGFWSNAVATELDPAPSLKSSESCFPVVDNIAPVQPPPPPLQHKTNDVKKTYVEVAPLSELEFKHQVTTAGWWGGGGGEAGEGCMRALRCSGVLRTGSGTEWGEGEV